MDLHIPPFAPDLIISLDPLLSKYKEEKRKRKLTGRKTCDLVSDRCYYSRSCDSKKPQIHGMIFFCPCSSGCRPCCIFSFLYNTANDQKTAIPFLLTGSQTAKTSPHTLAMRKQKVINVFRNDLCRRKGHAYYPGKRKQDLPGSCFCIERLLAH